MVKTKFYNLITGSIDAMISKLEDGAGYLCLVCHKVVVQKGNLKKHISSMHIGDQPRDCNFCGKRFKNMNSLQNHISLSHRTNK